MCHSKPDVAACIKIHTARETNYHLSVLLSLEGNVPVTENDAVCVSAVTDSELSSSQSMILTSRDSHISHRRHTHKHTHTQLSNSGVFQCKTNKIHLTAAAVLK